MTDTSGAATSPWQLGTVAGAQTATCSATAAPSLPLTATATASALASLTAQAPTAAAVVGTLVSPAPTFVVADRFGNPIGEVPISLEVTSGSASLQTTELTTDALGTAAAGVTPSAAGLVHLVATSAAFTAGVDLHVFDPVSLGVPQSHFDSVELSWTASGDPSFVAYRLYRSDSPGVTEGSTLVATVSDAATTAIVDTPPVQGQLYYYRLFADFQGGFTIASEEREGRAGLLLDLGADGFEFELPSLPM